MVDSVRLASEGQGSLPSRSRFGLVCGAVVLVGVASALSLSLLRGPSLQPDAVIAAAPVDMFLSDGRLWADVDGRSCAVFWEAARAGDLLSRRFVVSAIVQEESCLPEPVSL